MESLIFNFYLSEQIRPRDVKQPTNNRSSLYLRGSTEHESLKCEPVNWNLGQAGGMRGNFEHDVWRCQLTRRLEVSVNTTFGGVS